MPKADKFGRVRPVVGIKQDGTKPKFTVRNRYTSEAEAQRRLELIRVLYERQCEYYKLDHWHPPLIKFAHLLAAGEPISDSTISGSERPQYLATFVTLFQEWGIPVKVTQQQTVTEGIELIKDNLETAITKLVKQELDNLNQLRGTTIARQVLLPVDPLELAETATLHEAISAWQKHIRKTGKRDEKNYLSGYSRSLISRGKWLKERHEDLPLRKLDLPALEKIHAYWRNRPLTHKKTRSSKLHVNDMFKGLWNFLRWLNTNPNYRWSIPKGAGDLSRRPIDLPSDDSDDAFQSISTETYIRS